MDGVSKYDLNSYIYPDVEEIEKVDVKILYFGYFHNGACLKIIII